MSGLVKMFINLEKDNLHRNLKTYAAKNGLTMKEVIKLAIIKYIRENK